MANKRRIRLCLNCKHKGKIKNSHHIKCCHPLIEKEGFKGAALNLSVTVSYLGIVEGYCLWPYNYDPIWIVSCEGFEEVVNEIKTEI